MNAPIFSLGLVLVVVAASHGCTRAAPEPDRTACEAACRSLLESGCGADLRPGLAEACALHCIEHGKKYARAGCWPARAAYLSCVATKKPACTGDCSPPLCLEEGHVGGACQGAYEEYARCIRPCQDEGVTRMGEHRDPGGGIVRYEVVRAGCQDCGARASKGAPPGAPCETASVCSQHCCACSGPGRYLGRACVRGACAAAKVACSLTESVACQ